MTRDETLEKAISRLADMFEYGHLQASMNPAEFINTVADRIASLTTDAEKNEEKIHDCKNDLITCFEMQPDWMDSDLEAILKKYFGGGKP